METFSGHLWRSPASEFQERTRERFIAKLVNKMTREYVIKGAADPHRSQHISAKAITQEIRSRKFRLRPPGDGVFHIKGPPGIHHPCKVPKSMNPDQGLTQSTAPPDTTLHMLSKSVKSWDIPSK